VDQPVIGVTAPASGPSARRQQIAFVLAASDHGTLIVNRLDYTRQYNGVGAQVLAAGSYEPLEVELLLAILDARRAAHGDGVVAIDCGANIGIHTIEWARRMTGWGSVIAIEGQERLFYALAGNVALNNCFNATALWAVAGNRLGEAAVPRLDYQTPASFGSLEFVKRTAQDLGQSVDYTSITTSRVRAITLDSLALPRVDVIKIDVEGMEADVLRGASRLIDTHRPVVVAEVLKSDGDEVRSFLAQRGYLTRGIGMNLLAVHPADPVVDDELFSLVREPAAS
jgi:FkbM family methyltransferase